jgi:hypothetical protein
MKVRTNQVGHKNIVFYNICERPVYFVNIAVQTRFINSTCSIVTMLPPFLESPSQEIQLSFSPYFLKICANKGG